VLGEHLLLYSADGRRRAYDTAMLDLPAAAVVARLGGRSAG
jgi:hypothetical protein